MLTAWKHLLWAVLYDEERAKRWWWGFKAFLIAMVAQLGSAGGDAMLTWSKREWFSRVVGAAVSVVTIMVDPLKLGKKPENK